MAYIIPSDIDPKELREIKKFAIEAVIRSVEAERENYKTTYDMLADADRLVEYIVTQVSIEEYLKNNGVVL